MLDRTMKRLHEEEREAQASTQAVSAAEATAWLKDLPALWAAADDSGRRLLTEALSRRSRCLGVLRLGGRKLTYGARGIATSRVLTRR